MPEGLLLKAAAVSLAGGLLSVDRTAAFQTMVSRPLVAAPAAALILGDLSTGLIIGAVLEILFAGDLPVGAYMPVHETALAVVAASVAVTAMDASPGLTASAALPLSLLAALPAARLAHRADVMVRRSNAGLYREAEAGLGRPGGLKRLNMRGLPRFFGAAAVSIFASLVVLMTAARHLAGFADDPRVFCPASTALVLLGVGALYGSVHSRRSGYLFAGAGAAAGAVLALSG